jgi:hypothetical protein
LQPGRAWIAVQEQNAEEGHEDERCLIAGGNFVENDEEDEGKKGIEQQLERQPYFPLEKGLINTSICLS